MSDSMRAWSFLFAAGLLETVWAVTLKSTHGFTRLWPSVGALIAMAASTFLLAAALKSLPVGTAYAVWTGLGAAGAVLVGIALLGEPKDVRRLVCVAMIVAGILGLRLSEEIR